jgi:hypothetical protein
MAVADRLYDLGIKDSFFLKQKAISRRSAQCIHDGLAHQICENLSSPEYSA